MISFKGAHFPKDVILYAVFFYVRYGVSYCDLEEIMEERGIKVDHATLNRWVVDYFPLIAEKSKKRKCTVATSWRIDETYVKVKVQWVYLYRAVDKFGDTVDFMLSEHRDEMAATTFFNKQSMAMVFLTKSSWIKAVLIMRALRICDRTISRLSALPSLLMIPMANNSNRRETSSEIDLPGANSLNYLKRMKRVIERTVYCGLYGVTLVRGKKDRIHDADGNEYIDCLSGAGVNVLGYGIGLEKIYAEQARDMQHSCFPYSPNIPAITLAERLIEITPGLHNKRVIFGLTGSDGCDCAIEAMRKFTHRHGLISFNYSYHGTTGLSEPASGFGIGKEVYEEEAALFLKHDYPTSKNECDIVLKRIENNLSTGGIGGVLIEPIQGDGGIIIPPAPGFFARLSELLKKYDALLMVDEVQTGMGRTGNWWAVEYEKVDFDILITAKGLSGGYAPISAVIGREEIMDSLDPVEQLFTYAGHPPSCAVALAVIQHIEKEGLMNRAHEVGARLMMQLKEIQKKYSNIIKDVRGRGLMIGMEIDISKDKNTCKLYATRSAQKGVYFGYFGRDRNVICIEPPLIISEDSLLQVVNVAEEVAYEMEKGRIPLHTQDIVSKYAMGLVAN